MVARAVEAKGPRGGDQGQRRIFDKVLAKAREVGASDIHLCTGWRVFGAASKPVAGLGFGPGGVSMRLAAHRRKRGTQPPL